MVASETSAVDLSSTEAAEAAIQARYCESGNALSWKFLYSPFSVLDGAEIAFLGLNPGGNAPQSDENRLCTPPGVSEYRDVSWRGKPPGTHGLQPQALALFDWLGVRPEDALAGNFVPFRSPNWESIRAPELSVSFGRRLWRSVFAKAKPRRVVVLTERVRNEVAALLEIQGFERISTGWGESCAYRGIGRNGVELIGLPHLSRYRLFGRAQSEHALSAILGAKAS